MKNKYQPKLNQQIKIYRTMRGRRPRRMLFAKRNTYQTLSEKMESMAKDVKKLPIKPSELAGRIMNGVETFEATWTRVFDETRMSVSPDPAMVECLEWLKDNVPEDIPYVAAYTAFGEGSFELKCITAMDMYLNSLGTDEEMSPELAAINTCVYVDLEAIADGARVGGCFENAAVVLMWVLLIAASLCVDALAIEALVTIGPLALLVFLGGYLGLELLYKLGDSFARQMGNLGVRYTSMLKKGSNDLKEGFGTMYENLLKSQRDEYVMEDDTDETWNEVTETVLEV